MWLTFYLLKINNTAVSTKRVLPAGKKKGIITLTLVISRESDDPPVTRRIYRMFKFFKVKTELEIQLEEYVAFKATVSPFIAEKHKEIITRFIKNCKYKSICEITSDDLNAYHIKVKIEHTAYTAIMAMQALRAFMRFHKHLTKIKPRDITNKGIELKNVAQNAIVTQMTKKRKVGRPPNVAFIMKVKNLRDVGGLGIRAIARAEKMNPSSICRAYHYDLSKV